MNADKNIFLEIASFIIRVRLKQTEDLFLQEKLYTDIKNYYSGFILSQKTNVINYTIEFVKKKKYPIIMKNNEMYLNFFSDNKKNKIVCLYDVGLMHFQLLLREALQRLLASCEGFLLHASASNYHGKAIIFPAKQGSGKSTVMSFLHDAYPALADDTVVIKKEKGIFYFYQTPFVETNHWVKKSSKRYAMGPVFFLRKSSCYKIEKIKEREYSIDRLAKQLRLYKEFSLRQMENLLDFAATSNFYFLYFGKDKSQILQLFRRISV